MESKPFLVQCQGLRAVAFLCIFTSHLLGISALGAWGVSAFLVLSGFLMTYNYLDQADVQSFGIRFASRKVRRLYRLHVVIMVGFFIVGLLWQENIYELTVKALLHLGLVQAWVPYMAYYYSLNDVSWYLCICVFAYACFGPVIRHLRQVRSRNRIILYLIGIGILELGVAVFAGLFANPDSTELLSMHWVTYVCPASRILEFLGGCCLGWLYLRNKTVRLTSHPWVMDLCAVCLTGISWIIYTYNVRPLGDQNIKFALLFLLPSMVLLWSILRNGILARILQTKVLVWIGNLSAGAFLIHGAMISSSRYLLGLLGVSNVAIVAVIAVLSTFGLCIIWGRVEKKVTSDPEAST